MLKFRFISILLGLLCSVGVPLFSSGQPLSTTLKEDYYRDMASRENIDPELRIIWYDSQPFAARPAISTRHINFLTVC